MADAFGDVLQGVIGAGRFAIARRQGLEHTRRHRQSGADKAALKMVFQNEKGGFAHHQASLCQSPEQNQHHTER
jgi:hypothetical protein